MFSGNLSLIVLVFLMNNVFAQVEIKQVLDKNEKRYYYQLVKKGKSIDEIKYEDANIVKDQFIIATQNTQDNNSLNSVFDLYGNQIIKPTIYTVEPIESASGKIDFFTMYVSKENAIGHYRLITKTGELLADSLSGIFEELTFDDQTKALLKATEYTGRWSVFSKTKLLASGCAYVSSVCGVDWMIGCEITGNQEHNQVFSLSYLDGKKVDFIADILDYYLINETCIRVKTMEGKYGVIDKTGVVIHPEYEEIIKDVDDVYYAVRQNGKWGILDVNGKRVFPCIYDYRFNLKEGETILNAKLNGKEIQLEVPSK